MFARLVTALALLLSIHVAGAAPKYNVLFIIADDLRTELGCYGSPLAKTPNIDALAATGVRFNRAYCQYPLCNPSRVSMLNGRHPSTTGVLGNRTDFRTNHLDWVTLPQLFKQNGYASLRSGKIFHGGIDDAESWTEGGDPRRGAEPGAMRAPTADELIFIQNQLSPEDAEERRRYGGSDRWIALPGNGESHGDYKAADRAIEYLRRHTNKPFFLACGFVKPHSPPTAPQRFYDLWDVDKIPLPPNFAPRPTVPEGFPKAAIRPRNADLFIGRDASETEAREMTRAYLASSAWMDWNVGRVLSELDRLGLRENTIVVFWGDHGYQLGERGKWSKAGSLFEQGTRTPFIVVMPKAKGNGQPSERVVQAVDIYPTLAELCGLKAPKGIEGRSLASLLKKPAARWNHPAFTVWSEDGRTLHGATIRTERWRYAEFGLNGANGAMLFDETADPNELKNLADDPKLAKVRADLSKQLQSYAARYQNATP
jgi:arylsulfatase A-like enzyme